jgi:hypothetical protein
MKVRTIHWEVEQELTCVQLKAPDGTPAEWWQVPTTHSYANADVAISVANKWKERHPDRRVRIVEVETKRQAYIKTESDSWRPE